MCAPMATRGRVIGTVYIDNRGDYVVDDDDRGLARLEAFAAEASVVVENVRLELEVIRKSELMAMLAHEIRNPLAGILGFSEIGVQSSETTLLELFQRIRRDGERLRRLVDNVLELARHDAGKIDWHFEAVDTAALIEEVVDSFRPMCEQKQLAVVVDTSALTTPARASADRLAQVLSNLLNNAVKFTPEGGRITITARVESVGRDDPDAPPLPSSSIEAWGPVVPIEIAGSQYVRVDVTDTGPGMSEEVRANLFQKFRQGTPGRQSGKGVGLGLYISREIIVRHGGSMLATSARGEGSTFSFRVPVAAGPVPPRRP
jgi:signal transduction histidine kinase